jgi:hypothetical protein
MRDWAREYFERGYAQRWGLLAPSDLMRLEAAGLWPFPPRSVGSVGTCGGCRFDPDAPTVPS